MDVQCSMSRPSATRKVSMDSKSTWFPLGVKARGSSPCVPCNVYRHRQSRGGDRQANAALHHIVKNRMTHDPRTRAYRDTHLAKGWTK